MAQTASPGLLFAIQPVSSHVMKGHVIVDRSLFGPIQEEITTLYRNYSALPGFSNQELPHNYAQRYFSQEIEVDTQNFIFNHFVLDYVLSEVVNKKLLVANWPRLTNVGYNSSNQLTYTFMFSQAPEIPLKEWRHFVFKAPRRKNYKDLDKQVALFFKSEVDAAKQQTAGVAQKGDWLCLKVTLLSQDNNTLFENKERHYWIRLTGEQVTNQLQHALLGMEIGSTLTQQSFPLSQNELSRPQEPCRYHIEITDIVKGNHLHSDAFKTMFKLKTKADIHRKLIEIFSYRNDISQRRSIVEELFHLLLTKHRFEVPKHIVTRKKEVLLESLKRQPDYHVYKSHRLFDEHLTSLSEKLLKEEIIIDQIAYSEEVTVTHTDISHYLHLFNNERLKEFIYFKPFIDNIEDSDAPLSENMLRQAVLREKTLNMVIFLLSD